MAKKTKKDLKKKIENLHLSLSKKDLKIKNQSKEITSLLNQNKVLKIRLELSKRESKKRLDYALSLESQLEVQDKAILRKDEQYKALKKLYKDDLINGDI